MVEAKGLHDGTYVTIKEQCSTYSRWHNEKKHKLWQGKIHRCLASSSEYMTQNNMTQVIIKTDQKRIYAGIFSENDNTSPSSTARMKRSTT